MYLCERVKGKYSYLYLMENYSENGVRKKKIIQSFGRVDNLSEETYQALKDKYTRNNLEKKLQIQRSQQNAVSRLLNIVNDLENQEAKSDDQQSKQANNFNKAMLLHYGHILLKPIWNELNLSYRISYLQRQYTKVISYSLANVLFYLTAVKILNPSSYISAYQSQTSFLCNPIEGICQDNIYCALDYFDEFKEQILDFAVKQSYENKQKDKEANKPRLIFFDCTNCFFETPYDAKEVFIHNFLKKVKETLRKQKYTDEMISEYLESSELQQNLDKEIALHEDEFLRMRGPSKESRFAQPLVAVSLVIDERGIPIDYSVFPGNKSEYKQVLPTIKRLKEKYNIKKCYFVADRGLNSTENLDNILKEELGFIVAQRVINQSEKMYEQIFNNDGWKELSLKKENELSCLSTDFGQGFKYKVCEYTKKTRVMQNNGKYKALNVKCKIIYTFSPKREKRDLFEINQAVAKAQQAIQNNKLMSNPSGSGWRAFVKTKVEKAQSKIEKDQYKAVELKYDVIENRKKLAGYSAIIYQDPQNTVDDKLAIDEITVLGSYHSLVKIEECFRIMKSNFNLRPMYVRLNNRINAHVLICVLALIIIRLLQIKLQKIDSSLTIEEIVDALNNATVLPVPTTDIKDYLFINCGFKNSIIEPKVTRAIQDDDNYNVKDVLEKYLNKREKEPDAIDLIIKAVNLKPLNYINTISSLKASLNIAASSQVVDETIQSIYRKMVS